MSRFILTLVPFVAISMTSAACRDEDNNSMKQASDATAEAPAELTRTAGVEAAPAPPPWQCRPCATGQPYMEKLDQSCPDEVAFQCKTIDCSTASFSACGIKGFNAMCPPGFVISGYSNFSRICEAYTCTRIPFPSGTYSECDSSTCAPGFNMSGYTASASACNGNEKVLCTAP